MAFTIRVIEQNTKNDFTINDLISPQDTIKIARQKGLQGKLEVQIFDTEQNEKVIFSSFNVSENDKVTCTVFPHYVS